MIKNEQVSEAPVSYDDRRGHRERLRQRFLKSGLSGMHDYEILELLLTYAIPRRDVKSDAKKLISEFSGLAGVLDASPEDLQAAGMTHNAAVLPALIKELCTEYLGEKMKAMETMPDPGTVADFARMKLSGDKDESFLIIFMNPRNQVMGYEVTQQGTVNRIVVYTRNIIKRALELGASGIIAAHNHPSGACEPSKEDLDLTQSIKKAANLMNIHLLDHVIVSKSGYLSFVEQELL